MYDEEMYDEEIYDEETKYNNLNLESQYGYEGLEVLNSVLNNNSFKITCKLKNKGSLPFLEGYTLIGISTVCIPQLISWGYKFKIASNDRFNNYEIVMPIELLSIVFDITLNDTKEQSYALQQLMYVRDIYERYVYPDFQDTLEEDVATYCKYLNKVFR